MTVVLFALLFLLNVTWALPSRQSRSPRNYCNCECGVVTRESRVVGGNVTKSHEFPWIAGLSHGGEFHCGAALISRRHLITAAHCVNGFNLNDLLVTLGDHDRGSKNRFSEVQVRRVRSVIKHEHFDLATYNNDIALLEIDVPVVFTRKISPVCLPSDKSMDYAGRMGIVAGWGRTGERGETSQILRKIVVPVWSTEQCHNSGYGEQKISGNMFCAGYTEGLVDSCQGDSGGPLQLTNSLGDMEIIGVVSWGRGCGRPNLPGIYTKVINYLHWIEENMVGECVCQTSIDVKFI
ncbi:hypothetical protein ABEB36_014228 [Hypothenemus hampei]|uniref:Peptidase S1 domain-containing protein n=1 Tax=Hypothenemus hampei TaxID=57062 RepID=A0ABD1E420_HYPHA